MWRIAWAELGSKPAIVLDLAAHHVVAERDLAVQAAGVGEVDRERIVVVGLGLADVVKQRAGDGDVAVDARGTAPRRRRRPGRPRACGRAGRGGRPGGSTWPPAPRESARQRGDSGRRSGRAARAAAAPGPSRSARVGRPRDARPAPGGPRQSSGSNSRSAAGRTCSIVIWRPNCGLTEKRPLTWTTLPGSAAAKQLATSSQATASTVPVLSASDQLQEVLAVFLLAQLALADAERPQRPAGRRRGRGGSGGRSPAAPRRACPGGSECGLRAHETVQGRDGGRTFPADRATSVSLSC